MEASCRAILFKGRSITLYRSLQSTNFCLHYFGNPEMFSTKTSTSRAKNGKAKKKPAAQLLASGKQTTLLSYFIKTTAEPMDRVSESSEAVEESQKVKRVEHEGRLLGPKNENDENGIGGIEPSSKRIKVATPPCPYDDDDEARGLLLEKVKNCGILDENMGISWFLALEKEFEQDYFKSLDEFVTNSRKRGTVFPPAVQVWEWTRHTPIHDVKVVILGQDPYHGVGQAHGLCFSVLNVAPPPSLVNMYKELTDDIPNFERPKHGCLIGWAEQGVLLLNAVLTVDQHQANSHKDRGWEKVTDATIAWISQNLTSVVFLLWGAYAQKKAAIVDKKKHHLLQAVHPSPLSAHKGFFGCKHFSKCNDLLQKCGKKPIDWNHLPRP